MVDVLELIAHKHSAHSVASLFGHYGLCRSLMWAALPLPDHWISDVGGPPVLSASLYGVSTAARNNRDHEWAAGSYPKDLNEDSHSLKSLALSLL